MSDANKSVDRKAVKLFLIGAIIFAIVLLFAYLATLEKPVGENQRPLYEYGGEFTLQSASGDVSLSDFEGKVVVMYFGFLNCTEACPISMARISKALQKLTPYEREQVQVLFVSVDPERDDLDSLEQFSKYYDEKNIIGITGTKQQVEALSDQYGVFFELVDLEGSNLGYTVDHSSRFYMVNQQGELVTTMSHSTSPIELAAKISDLIENPVSIKPQTGNAS